MRRRRRIRLGAALVLGGATFGVIQILQASIAEFNPRPIVEVLMAVCVALLGWTLGMANESTGRSQRLISLLRDWPLHVLSECDGLELGVFPARPRAGTDRATESAADPPAEFLPPYVPRELDGALREAIRGGGMVLVVGAERSGKSRTAFEAARAVAGARPVVVPVDGAALSALAEEAESGFGVDAVWWLDDLERYLDHLGGVELSLLLDSELTVVATLRERGWEALLRASGDAGETGRRLRGCARVFLLPAELTPQEAASAANAFGDLDLRRGLGETLSASATGEAVGRPVPRAAGRKHPDPVTIVAGLLTAASVIAFCAVILSNGFARPTPPSLAAQVDAIRQRAASAREVVTFARSESLHGFGGQSYVFILRPAKQGSDELRIYDLVDGYLRLRLDFQPHTSTRGLGDTFNVAGAPVHQGFWDYGLENVRVLDAFDNGEQELVGDYSAAYDSPLDVELPVIAFWDDLANRYRMERLLSGAPSTIFSGYPIDPSLQGAYALRDTARSQTLLAWATNAYSLTPATSTGATLTIVDDISGSSRFSADELVDSYDLTPSVAGVDVTETGCSEGVLTNDYSLTPAQIAQIERSAVVNPRLKPAVLIPCTA